MKIYICHQFQNNEENKLHVESIIKELVRNNPQHTFISPINCFGYLYNEVSYEQGMEYCLDLLKMCDVMFTFGKWSNSRGCKIEKQFCIDNNIQIKDYGSKFNEVKFVQCLSCSECAKKLNDIEREKQKLLQERSQLMRCRGCEKLRGTKKDE